MKLNLFLNYYVDRSPNRQYELQHCLMANILCDEIDKIIVVLNRNHQLHFFEMMIKNDLTHLYKKVFLVFNEKRPTYSDWFSISRLHSKEDEISCLINTDILFDNENVLKIKNFSWDRKYCMILTRWDIQDENDLGSSIFFDRPDSQDTWIVKGSFDDIEADFTLGVAGCDNKIAYLLNNNYELINPSIDIKTYHFHNYNVRNYINFSQIERVLPPYFQIKPTTL